MESMSKEPRGQRRRGGRLLVLLLFLVVGGAFVGSAVYAGVTGDAGC